MNKKSMSFNFLVSAIIVLVAFVIISGILTTFVLKSNDKEAEKACQSSVALRAATALSIGDGAEIRSVPILCKTIDKKIQGTKDEVKRQFADNMVKCWEMFGEGKYDKNIFDNLAVFGGSNRCFMCYTLMVDESSDFKKGDKITADEFKDYLINTEHPKLKGVTYLNYFQSTGGRGQVLGILSNDGITPGNSYAVGYKAKATKCSWCEYIAVGSAGATVVGLVILAIPTGGLSLTAVSLVVAGGATSIATGSKTIDQEFFSEVNIDTIYFVDMNNKQLQTLFENSCEKVEDDVGGK